jgi:hypothetical protein
MQCFQKDPNLRVSARKLLKHAWIVGSRRSDAPVSKPPANFKEAVEEVKQWNEALKSPNNGSLRASRSSANSPLPIRKAPSLQKVHSDQQSSAMATPAAKGPLTLVKARNTAEAFRSPESTGTAVYIISTELTDMKTADDNWDDDFATSISPSALQLPHLKPHDNFGGLFSSDKLKSFASIEEPAGTENENWDDNFEGDLMTIKGPFKQIEADTRELDTIRPVLNKPDVKSTMGSKSHIRKQSGPTVQRPRTAGKDKAEQKSTIPSRPVIMYREQSTEDYSDILIENENLFDRRLNLIKVNQKLYHITLINCSL